MAFEIINLLTYLQNCPSLRTAPWKLNQPHIGRFVLK